MVLNCVTMEYFVVVLPLLLCKYLEFRLFRPLLKIRFVNMHGGWNSYCISNNIDKYFLYVHITPEKLRNHHSIEMNWNRLRQVAEQNACYLTRHLTESLAFTKLSGVRNHVVNDKIKTGQSILFSTENSNARRNSFYFVKQ